MMQPEILQDSGSIYEELSSFFDQIESFSFNVDTQMSDCDFNSLYSTSEETFEVSTTPSSSIMFSNDFAEYEFDNNCSQQLPSLMEDFSMDLGNIFDSIFGAQIVGIHGFPEENEGSFDNSQHVSSEIQVSWSPTASMMSVLSAVQSPLTLPHEDMKIDNQFAIPHLLEALAEAMEQGHNPLAEEILRHISRKVSPLGNTLEHVAFNLSQDITFISQDDYLRKETYKNLEPAFQTFYQWFPHGKVAHFAANSRILESIPVDSNEIHIVDFDMGEGIQWVSLIEAIAQQHRTLKLTSIKWEDESPECVFTSWNFEDTEKQLSAHAKSCGLKLKVEEKGIEDLVIELKKMNKRGGSGKREWLAFNCMVGLPHMGRPRSRRHAVEFLRAAKDLICSYGNKGIITFGDGDVCEKLKNCMNFRSFFEGNLVHYQALLESIEANFPKKHSEARIAMESLFVGPYVSPLAWLQKWEEVRKNSHLQGEIGLEGSRFSKEIVMEIGEMLKGSECSYQARLEGDNDNELVLGWNGTQLLRISTWGI
ncbi:hypothetical protein L6164_002705 [Bauhinia variegata]|uniref:Uncharacterized protein n=1 Tax=Bauhinia variegata TaxID=167791 RepID=A0ACB9Q152_BAUVA|nr:hypothetical protein L6164_002705 [Bauhinia variegata]